MQYLLTQEEYDAVAAKVKCEYETKISSFFRELKGRDARPGAV